LSLLSALEPRLGEKLTHYDRNHDCRRP
jgi:hypothetical protein